MMDEAIFPIKPMGGERPGKAERIPPEAFFICSAIFHYLCPAFAVLLFARVDVLGVAWLRIASAAVVFAAWKRPWRLFAQLETGEWRVGRGSSSTFRLGSRSPQASASVVCSGWRWRCCPRMCWSFRFE